MASDDIGFGGLFASMPQGIIVWRLEDPKDPVSLKLVDANRAASALTNRDVRAMRGKFIHEIFPAVAGERVAQLAAVAAGADSHISDVGYRDEQVSDRVFRTTFVPLPNRSVAAVFEDITAQAQKDRELREMKTFLESVVENIPNMIFVKDAEHLRFERFNRAGEELLGLDRKALLGKSDYDFFPKEQADFFIAKDREVLAGGALLDIPEEDIQTGKGTRWLHTKKIPILDADGKPKYLLGISEDITERKTASEQLRRANEELEVRVRERTAALEKSQEQLRHSQKMEAVGRLAGGIAHDFNNLLSVILSYADMMIDGLPEDDPLRTDLGEVKRAGVRAAGLTRQLLAFSRQQVMEARIVDLNEIIAHMNKMLARVLGEDIELRTIAADDLCKVKVDPGQIEQVIMNLVVNARDAMPDGGSLTIETANVMLDDAYAREHFGVTPGPHAMIAVSDTGVGMDKATQGRVFEPFFTTKELGKGTGLGLSTVFGIVKQSQGSIFLYSEPGRGTTFKVYLPRARGDVKPTTIDIPMGTSLRGTETVLLVEDEDQVRAIASGILKRNGYRVLEAKDAREAVRIHEEHKETIHLLLTDVVMPQTSGRKLAERLGAERPSMRVLYMSGYTHGGVVEQGPLEEGVAFLQKPLTPDLLARKVREVLDAAPRRED